MISGVTIINSERRSYPIFQAREIARELQSSEVEGWEYKIVIEDNRAYIEVYDEDSEFVSYWNSTPQITKINGVDVRYATERPN